MVYAFNKEICQEGFSKCKKRRCNIFILRIHSNKSNNLDTSNSDNVIGTSKFPHRNFPNGSPLNTLITL